KETMESLCPGSTWSCFGVGHSAMEMLYGAVAMGGHVRVGMEDNVMYAKGQLAESNEQFVLRAARVIREFGNEVATPICNDAGMPGGPIGEAHYGVAK